MAIGNFSASNFISSKSDPCGLNYTAYSWSIWVNFSQTYSVRQTIVCRQRDGSATNICGYLAWRADGAIEFDDYPPSGGILISSVINLVGWHHIAAIRKAVNPNRRIIVDGTMIGIQDSSETYSGIVPNNIKVGSAANTSGPSIYGTFFDVRLYNRTISDGEISALYSSRGRDGITSGLVMRTGIGDGCVGLGSMSGKRIYDHSPSPLSISVSGAVSAAVDPFDPFPTEDA